MASRAITMTNFNIHIVSDTVCPVCTYGTIYTEYTSHCAYIHTYLTAISRTLAYITLPAPPYATHIKRTTN